MGVQKEGINKRFYPRVGWSFMVRFRPKGSADAKWELATINDISEGGCFFYCVGPRQAGDILEIEVQLPALQGYMRFNGEIKRCQVDSSRPLPRYGLAVQFHGMDEEKKRQFVETLNFFLRRQEKK